MHYYKFHIGDYRSNTAHLSNEEDIAYRRLIDMYYDTESEIPLKTHWVSRRLRVDTEVIARVLKDFFVETENGWFHPRCAKEIEGYGKKAKANRNNGAKGGRPKKEIKTQPEPTGLPTESESNPNHKPLTINHKPIKKTLTIDSVRKKSFFAPDKKETASFFTENGSTNEEAGKFWYHYDANGWMCGKVKMRNWTSAAKKWMVNSKTNYSNANGYVKRNGTLGYQQPITHADLPGIMQSIADDDRYA